MSINVHPLLDHPADALQVPTHSRWYFISRPVPMCSPPPIISHHAEMIIYHYAKCPADYSLNIIVGFVRFDRRFTHEELECWSGYLFQWIPAIFASTHSASLSVDFSAWKKDDFDVDTFVQQSYPWDLVSESITHYTIKRLGQLPWNPHRDSIILYL